MFSNFPVNKNRTAKLEEKLAEKTFPLKKFSELVFRKRYLWGLLAFYFLQQIILAVLARTTKSLDSHFAYSLEYAVTFFGSLSEGDILKYKILNMLDFLYIITYFLLGTSFIYFLIQKNIFFQKKKYFLVWQEFFLLTPLVLAAIDFAETFGFFVQLHTLPQIQNILLSVCVVATPVKWILLIILLFEILFLLALLGGQKLKKMNSL